MAMTEEEYQLEEGNADDIIDQAIGISSGSLAGNHNDKYVSDPSSPVSHTDSEDDDDSSISTVTSLHSEEFQDTPRNE